MDRAHIQKSIASRSWHSKAVETVLTELGTTPAGLSADEATRRLATQGPNTLQEGKRISALQIGIEQFKSLMVWILIAAGAISAVLGEYVDAIAILAIVLLNALIGFYQEYQAEQSIAALKKMTAPQAKVKRGDAVSAVASTDVVAGDILLLEAGDLVPADARLLEAAAMRCVESALTGESAAVNKRADVLLPENAPLGDRANMIFMGTSVATGTGAAVVVATAMESELGHIAGMLKTAGEDDATPLQHKLGAVARVLVIASLGIVALLFGVGLLRGTPLIELLMTSISLAVAAVPEGLPAVVTVALALGVFRMSRRRALIRKLAAVETLGATTVICTDKTGTLTVGEMTVRCLYVDRNIYAVTGEGYGPEGEVRIDGRIADASHAIALRTFASNLIGCNNAHLMHEDGAWRVVGDPTEGAMLAAGAKAGGDWQALSAQQPKQFEIPFDSDRKRAAVIRRTPNGLLRAYINGAPDRLLQQCTGLYTSSGVLPLTEELRREVEEQNSAMAHQALRVLGSAYRDLGDELPQDLSADAIERDLVFVGLCGMYDPPRPEAKSAVAKCHDAGVRVVMITGDHPHTALAIARELGIASHFDAALTGVELDQLPDSELMSRIHEIAVYARVTAAHKLRIIQGWKARQAVVAMTGDGVNDAPAIKGADIGIAMGRSGTEVTKQASDMIVTDDNFASIVAAIEEGRGIYDNIRKTLQYLLAGNTAELLLMIFCVVIGLPVPLLPIHLLWINLITDGLPALCLATDPVDSDVMKRPPRPPAERLTNSSFLLTMVVTGFLTAGVALAVYLQALQTTSEELARTQAFAVLVFAELLRAFGCRSETRPVWRISLATNLNLALVVAISFSLQVWSHHNEMLGRFLKAEPLSLWRCFELLAVGAIPLIVLELGKLMRIRFRHSAHAAVTH